MASSRRSYRREDARPRLNPLKLLLVVLVFAVLLGGIGLGVLILVPELASSLPGQVGLTLHALATAGRDRLEALISDTGPLGGIRRSVEPYLSKVGLNLQTLLLGLGLIVLMLICIRVLSVTSRPDAGEEEVFPTTPRGAAVRGGLAELRGGAEAETAAGQPYWPYNRRPVDLGSGYRDTQEASAAGRAPEEFALREAWAEEAGAFTGSATGDAWPLLGPGSGPGPENEGLADGDQDDLSQPLVSASSLSQEELAPSEVSEGSLDDIDRQYATGTSFPGPAPYDRTAAAAAGEPEFAPQPGRSFPADEYLDDMPAPSFPPIMRAPLERPLPGPRAVPGPLPVPGVQPREGWGEVRPGLGAGLKKFILPGLVLALVGAGGAYGARMPATARFLTGGPYGPYLLGSAAGVISMALSVWFMNGPMKSSPKRLAAAGAGPGGPSRARWNSDGPGTAQGRWGGLAEGAGGGGLGGMAIGGAPLAGPSLRVISGAPIPARAALEGGLEAPDALDWSDLPRPSVFLPGTQAATIVGLDIGTAWTKVVQVGVSRGGIEIMNLGLCPTPEGALSEGGIADPITLGEAIKDLLSGRNIIQKNVVSALGGQGVIIRHVQFPVMSPDELREVLRWEAEHHIPIPPADAVVDFTVMPGQADARGNQQMRVMLVGAQKRVVEAQVEALRQAKLVPRGIDAEALACYRVVRAAGHFVDDPLRYAQAIIDLGHSSTKVGIYLKGALEMSRTLGVGGRTFTTVLAQRLQVPEVEAETLKRQYGVHPEGGRVVQSLTPTLQDLMFEIRRSFHFFASRHFGQSVRHVYLIGGGARMPGIAAALSRYLNAALGERAPEGAGTRVQIIDPLSAVALSPRLSREANLVGPEFVTALGLALTDEEAPHES